MTPIEYKEKGLPLPVKALLVIRKLKENVFAKITVYKIHKNTCDIVYEFGTVSSHGIPHYDIVQIGEIE